MIESPKEFCKACKQEVKMSVYNKFKDVIELDGYYYTVYLGVCPECGAVFDKYTWVE